MKRRIVIIGIAVAAAAAIGLAGLLNTQAGSRWLLRKVFSLPAVSTTVDAVEGTLLKRLTLRNLVYRKDAVTVRIGELLLVWHPSALLRGRIMIADLRLDDVDITLGKPEKKSDTRFQWDQGYRLPVQLTLDNLLVTRVLLHQNGQTRALDKLLLSAATAGDEVRIRRLSARTPDIQADLKGSVGLNAALPVKVSAFWRAELDKNGSWNGTAAIYGDARRLNFSSRITSPFTGSVQGRVSEMLAKPALKAVAAWQSLVWPFAGDKPQIGSRYGSVAVVGPLDHYRVLADACARRQDLPEACLLLDGVGGAETFAVDLARLGSSVGRLSVKGEVDWGKKSAFALTAAGRRFNPAVFVPQLPGSLTFAAELGGRLDLAALSVDIRDLGGTLRGYRLSGGGNLKKDADTVTVHELTAALGPNRIGVDGALGPGQSALALVLNCPELAALWPGLQGELSGRGKLDGALTNPAVDFNAVGRNVGYAGARAGIVNLTVDYRPGGRQVSAIEIAARRLTSGGGDGIAGASLNGRGTPERHRFELNLTAGKGRVSALLEGGYQAPLWQGALSRLDIATEQAGRWRLNRPLDLRLTRKKPEGFEIAASASCLMRGSAELCLRGRYKADGDFDGELDLNRFPFALVQSLLPNNLQSDAVLTGEGGFYKRGGRLSGTYQLSVPKSTLAVGGRRFGLGASSVAGVVKNDAIANTLNLALTGQDYLRGRIVLNTGKAASVDGKIAARLDELTLVQAFTPQIKRLQGRIAADLAVKGPLSKPAVTGVVDIADGALETEAAKVEAINVSARALKGERLLINASAEPRQIGLQGKEAMTIDGGVQAEADLRRQKNGFGGVYRIKIPGPLLLANSRYREKLGPATLAGAVNGPELTADLDMTLHGEDYLRADAAVDTSRGVIKNGRVTASITDFAWVEILASQVAEVKGRLTADVGLSGSAQNPQIAGHVRLHQASAQVPEAGIALRGVYFQAQAAAGRPGELTLSGFAESGEGYLDLKGEMDWRNQAGVSAHATVRGEDFQVVKLPELQVEASPDLKVGYAGGDTRVDGTVTVPKASLEIQEFPENAVKVSNDEIILGETPPEARRPYVETAVNVEIVLGKKVSFKGMGLKSDLSGHMKIASNNGWLSAFGTVEMVNASYKSYGQDLTVRKGRFTFNGPTDDPWLDVEASRLSKSRDVTAVLSLTGPLSQPKTKIYTEPELPETEALSYLITGNSLSQLSKAEGNQVASAAISYGAGQLTWLTEKLGIQNFAVEQGQTLQDTLVTAGRYLTPDFYVGTKVGFFNKQALLIMKRKLTSRFNVETQTGTSQRIKLNYEFDSP